MNWKIPITLMLLVFILFTVLACAEKDGEQGDTTEESPQEQVEEEYSPDVVETLTEDFNDMKW